MIKRLEQLLEEIAKEPRSDTYNLSAKQLEFFDLVEELKSEGEYHLWYHYTGRLNQILDSKYPNK